MRWVIAGLVVAGCQGAPKASREHAGESTGTRRFFTENVGQLQNEFVRLYGQGSPAAAFLRGAVLLKLTEPERRPLVDGTHPDGDSGKEQRRRGVLLRLTFEGARAAEPEGRGELPHRTHFFRGDAPARWRTGVRNYKEVVYRDLYDGIDAVYRVAERGLKYEFHVAPGADPAAIRIRYEGVEGLRLEAGELVVRTQLGELRDEAPRAYQDEHEVRCGLALRGPRAAGFDCQAWDRAAPLIIDPLVYSTFLGGGSTDYSLAIAHASGSAYVTGQTDSMDFPTTPGAYDEGWNMDNDAFVVRLAADGSAPVYATYVGGTLADIGYGVAVDSSGSAYVAGQTASTDFPATVGALGGTADAFVVKLGAAGDTLEYGMYLGGGLSDLAYATAVDATGRAYVVGGTFSTDFPVTLGAYDESHNAGNDGFVARVDAAGTLLEYATFLGGDMNELAYAIAVDGSSNAFVSGGTLSANFPATLGAAYEMANGGLDAFVAKLNADGSDLVYSTFLGGNSLDRGFGIAVDAAGVAYVTGTTSSTDFPATAGAYDTSANGGEDAFVAKLSADGSTFEYVTYLGETGVDYGDAIAVDGSGGAYVTGQTTSSAFPTTVGAYDTSHAGMNDAFIAKLNSTGDVLLYGTLLGDLQNDQGNGIALDAACNVYVSGSTDSSGFPTTPGAYDTTQAGGYDAFVTKLDPGCGEACCSAAEDSTTCPQDCGVCPDGMCTGGETCTSCPADCDTCGDGCCIPPEDVAGCAQDCSVCSDGMCTGVESCVTCPADCDTCGDGCCISPEDCTCVDCPCTPPAVCMSGLCLAPDMGASEAGIEPAPDAAPPVDMLADVGTQAEAGPEPGVEPGVEPGPEPGMEPPPDAPMVSDDAGGAAENRNFLACECDVRAGGRPGAVTPLLPWLAALLAATWRRRRRPGDARATGLISSGHDRPGPLRGRATLGVPAVAGRARGPRRA